MRHKKYFSNKLLQLPILALLLSTMNVQADAIFEGYYKVLSGGVSVGYVIQRYDYDSKKKQFTAISFLKTNTLGGDITESLVAKATNTFKPISYQYTGKTGDKLSTIDATFNKNVMKAIVSDGKTANTVTKKLPSGTFLSTFLAYLMLNKGYAVGKKFDYSAISEEDGEPFNGQALVHSEATTMNQKGFKLLNKFKGVRFVAYINAKAEVLRTKSPLQQISTELVATPAEATKGHTVPHKVIRQLFGGIPLGKVNTLNSSQKSEPKPKK
ncbi:MAG: hypothetical protein KDD61_10515 [Bdellovibrionales bacterium]|nr:hypothetical protein [Bdellovibrionales bacterium]